MDCLPTPSRTRAAPRRPRGATAAPDGEILAPDGATARKLYDAFLAFDADNNASVAVFTGTGGYFCAGADLKAIAKGDRQKKRELGKVAPPQTQAGYVPETPPGHKRA